MLLMYRLATELISPTILELGTQNGVSATVFLQACNENNGTLVSVDIDDCSTVSTDPRFHFVKSDSTDAAYVINQAPELLTGIDLLYVDTLHTRDHVIRELSAWWPHLKSDSIIVFDDVDPHNYRPGQSRDNVGVEISNEQIAQLIEEIYRANMDDLELQYHLGSSGKAVLRKCSPKGQPFVLPSKLKKRNSAARAIRSARVRLSQMRNRFLQFGRAS